ncbi:MAG TPA: adenylyltransferase/cytidyltransferase family protein, partial [Solirubrobacterales bacterium]|nr:adenylyltransferase/cytidyltransferase family protein [Solirubrobacterales bacterium]
PIPGADLVTPNLEEAARFAGDATSAGERRLGELALALAVKWGAGAVCVTRGAAGALLAVPPPPPKPARTPFRSVSEKNCVRAGGVGVSVHRCEPATGDPCGAGDRFAAEAAWALGGGAARGEAVSAAVSAAAEFVAASGARRTASLPISPFPGPWDGKGRNRRWAHGRRPGGINLDLRRASPAPLSIGPALELAELVRRAGGAVVATGGCFDLLHVGHVRTLEAARALGDCLVVLLNGDRSVRALKGPERPLVSELERAAMLKALGCVDEVAIFDEPDPSDALRLLRPDVWAKGGDYAMDELPEHEAVASWGGRTVILPYLEGRSTTRLIEEVGERVER